MSRKRRLNSQFGRSPYSAFYNACRNTIYIECIVKCKREKMYSDGYVCELTGRFHKGDCQLHHEGVSFAEIVAKFKEKTGFNETNSAIISRGHRHDRTKLFFKSSHIRLLFADFHEEHATLVPVNPAAHDREHRGLPANAIDIFEINFL